MSSSRKPCWIRNPQYPSGNGLLLAWDVTVREGLIQSVYLLQGVLDDYFVHYHDYDGSVRERVVDVSRHDAESLFDRLKIRFGPFPASVCNAD